jgi:hypothetical protein
VGYVSRIGVRKVRVLVGTPKGKSPLERLRGISKIGGWGCGVCSAGQDRDRCRAVVNAMMNLRALTPRVELILGTFVTKRHFGSSYSGGRKPDAVLFLGISMTSNFESLYAFWNFFLNIAG